MTAKEYFKDDAGIFQFNGEEFLILRPVQVESYHQAKSNEEAEVRFNKAVKYFESQHSILRHEKSIKIETLGQIINMAMNIAAFGKEGEG